VRRLPMIAGIACRSGGPGDKGFAAPRTSPRQPRPDQNGRHCVGCVAKGLARAYFGHEPAFLLRGLSYMRDLPWNMPTVARGRMDGVDGGGR
jgi:hypothetical protein